MASCALLTYITTLSPTIYSPLTSQLEALSISPNSRLAHVKLAETYNQLRRQQDASQEIQLARESIQNSKVLGEISDLNTIEHKITSEPKLIEKQREFWMSITKQYPKYIDAWIQLWYLDYNHNLPTQIYREAVLQLDPNYLSEMPGVLLK